MKKDPIPMILTLFLILLVGVSGSAAASGVLYVDGAGVGENYTTIQEAVNAANADDTILVYPENYSENVEVNKAVTIKAVSTDPADTTIEANNSAYPVFNVTANNVTISGFSIEGATALSMAGIYLDDVINNTISNNVLENNYYGICLDASSNNNLTGNIVSGNLEEGIFLLYSDVNTLTFNDVISNDGNGIYLGYSNNNYLTLNNVSLNYYRDIYIQESDYNRLVDNDVIGKWEDGGEYYFEALNAHIEKFTRGLRNLRLIVDPEGSECGKENIDEPKPEKLKPEKTKTYSNLDGTYSLYNSGNHGICLEECNHTIVTLNTISSHEEKGISMCGYNNTLEYNDIVSNNVGLYIYEGHDLNLTSNNVTNNRANGIKIYYGYNISLTGNNASNNVNGGIIIEDEGYDLTLTNNDVKYNGARGIVIEDEGYNLTLTGNNVSYNECLGVYIYDSYNLVLIDNDVSYNGAVGIKIEDSLNSELTDNTATYNSCHGIYLYDSENSTLTDNNASFNGFSLELNGFDPYEDGGNGIKVEGENNTLIDNLVSHNKRNGIYVYDDYTNVINNNINHNGLCGIYVEYSEENKLQDNIISSNGYSAFDGCKYDYRSGISLYNSCNNSVTGNTLENNTIAGVYLEGSSGNTIYNNYFKNANNTYFTNEMPPALSGLDAENPNIWNTTLTKGTNVVGGPYLGGNFWALPDGTGWSQTCNDTDKDGICDLPYNVTEDAENIDYFPLSYAPEPEAKPSNSGSTMKYAADDSEGDTLEVDSSQKKVDAGTQTRFQFNDPENGVHGISFKSKKYSGVVQVRVEGTSGSEADVKPKGKVHRYIRILVGSEKFESSDNLDGGIIEFSVPKSWFEENGIDPATIALNRYSDGAWDSLPTAMTGEDGEYYYFTATTPGFSLYAITGGDNSTGEMEETEVITPAEEEEVEKVTREEQTKEEETEKESTPGFEGALAALGILGSAFFVRKEMLK